MRLFSLKMTLFLLLLVAGIAQANGARPLISMAVTSGGDDLLSIVSPGGTDEITAGGMLSLSFGGSFLFEDPNLEGRISIGYFFDSQTYSNGDASFDRFPLQGLFMYKSTDKFSLGGGFVYHINPKVSCNITAVCSGDISFDNALGYVLQTDWLMTENEASLILIGLRYTSIEYDTSFGGSADGSHFGLVLTSIF